MSLTVGELNAYLRLDDGSWKRSLDVAGAEFQRFKSRIDVQLQELERSFKEMSAQVKITADTRQAEKDVRAFIRRMNALRVSINVNVSAARALQQLQQIEDRVREISRLSASITVRADTGDTAAELRAIRDLITRINGSRPSVTVNANTARAEAALRRLEAAQRDAGRDHGLSGIALSLGGVVSAARNAASSLAGVAGSAGLIAAVLGAAIPVAAGLAAALVAIAPAAAIGATAVFSLASAFGAIKLGTSGIGGAFKAAFAPAVSGGGAAAGSANQAASAMQAVKDATQQAAYANQAAARTVVDAERNVADAQKASKQAQLDLNDARQQAVRDLRDLNDQLTDARFDERDASAEVTQALGELNQARANGMGPGTDLDALQLAYDKAVQKLKEAKEHTDDLTTDTAKANKAGVDGSQTMVAAKQKVADSNRTLSDQERALSDARVQQARTAAAGLESIQKAEEALAAAGASAGGGGGGVDKLGQALAKLSPNARAFVMQVIALKGAWTSMQQAVQNKLFEGLAASLKTTAASVLPVLRTGLVQSAGALNLMAKGAMAAATGVAKDGTLGMALSSASAGLHNLAGIPGIVVKALTQLAAAAGPAFEQLTAAAGRGAASIGAKLNDAFKSGRMKAAIDQAVTLIKQIGKIAGNVGSILGSLFSAANASGGGFLNTLQTITGALATAFKSDAVQAGLRALFQTMALIARTVGPLLITALQSVAPVLVALAPPVQHLVTALGSALGPIIKGLGPILVVVAQAFGQLLTGFEPVIAALPQLMGPIAAVVSALASAGPAVGLLLVAFNPFLGILVLLSPVLAQLVAPIGALLKGLSPLIAAVGVFAGQLGQALVPIVTALAPVLGAVAGVLGSLLIAVAPLLKVLGTLIAVALKPLGPIFKTIGGVIQQLAPVVAKLAAGLGKALTPVLSALGVILGKIITQYAKQFTMLFTQMAPVIAVIIPVLVQLGESLGQILLAIAPLIPQVMLLSVQMITMLLPAILPLVPLLADLTEAFLILATWTITKVVVPVMSGLIKFMQGLQHALKPAVDAVEWVTKTIAGAFQWLFDILLGHSIIPDIVNGAVRWFASLPAKAWGALSGLAGNLAGRARDAGVSMVNAIRTGLSNAVAWINGLPGRAVNALGNMSGKLYDSGKALIQGFIDGISSKLGAVGNAVSSVLGAAADFFPHSPAKKGPFSGRGYPLYSGQAIGAATAVGLLSQRSTVSDAARQLAAAAQSELAVPGTPTGALTTPPGAARGYAAGHTGAGGGTPTRVIISLIGADDAVVKAVRSRIKVSGGSAQVVLGTG